jgi:hypothetical protein
MGGGYLTLDEWDFCMVRISDALFKRQLRDDLSSAKAVTALDMIPIIARRPAVRRMVYFRAQQPATPGLAVVTRLCLWPPLPVGP